MKMEQFSPGVNGICLFDLMKWANQAICDNKLRLPAVQRGALWDHRQITGLWDSLLAGMPVGMFYLLDAREGGRHFITDVRLPPPEPGAFDLLDGQQRLRAMMLGFRQPGEYDDCLWVNLEKEDSTCSGVQFLLTTRGRPFGWNEKGEKLSWQERTNLSNELRKCHQIAISEPENQLFNILIEKEGRPPAPSVAKNAVPLHNLLTLWQTSEGQFPSEVKAKFGKDRKVSDDVMKRLISGFETLKQSSMAVFLLPANKVEGKGKDKWLLDWFGRIGRGGTPLTVEEQNYSTYKHHKPDIVEAVRQVHEKGKGRILSAPEIADTAIRIANAMRDDVLKRSFARVDPADFSNWLLKDGHFEKSLDDVLSVTAPEAGLRAKGKLVPAFEALSKAILFSETTPKLEPHGLPRFMVASLPRELIQILALWLVKHPDEANDPQVRAEMIRLSLYWSLCVGNQGRALTAAFKAISAQDGFSARGPAGFPGHAIYREIAANQSTNFPLIAPTDLSNYLRREGGPEGLPNWGFLFDQPLDAFKNWQRGIRWFAWVWWSKNQTILMWLEAEYLENRLPSYDPLAINQEDTPFDLDHILPQKTFKDIRLLGESQAINESFKKEKYWFCDSIGNKCWLASTDNRAAGDKAPLVKIKNLLDYGDTEIGLLQLGGNSYEELRCVWEGCSEGGSNWSPERIVAFRSVIEDRVLRLYHEFWRKAGFDEWVGAPGGLDPTGAGDTPEMAGDDF